MSQGASGANQRIFPSFPISLAFRTERRTHKNTTSRTRLCVFVFVFVHTLRTTERPSVCLICQGTSDQSWRGPPRRSTVDEARSRGAARLDEAFGFRRSSFSLRHGLTRHGWGAGTTYWRSACCISASRLFYGLQAAHIDVRSGELSFQFDISEQTKA